MRVVLIAMLLAACESSDVSRDIGARCGANSDCNVECLSDFPGGFCTLLCDSDADCPDGTRCITESNGVCVFGCGSDADCAFLDGGYTCQASDSQGGGTKDMVCLGSD